MQRWTLVVSGKVQGVFFRKSTAEQAQVIGVRGCVRNLSNGDVEVIAEGSPAQLQQLHDWCQHGPDRARVDSVEVTRDEATGEYADFRVRH